MLRIGISGACGKMGKRIADLAEKDPDIQVSVALEKEGVSGAGITVDSDLEKVCGDMDCLIEFTSPEATLKHLEVCVDKGIPMVIGTTGLDPESEKKIKSASGSIPIVFSPNMSVGVNLLFNIVREAARVLGDKADIRIDETHHAHKKDSPSGTAKMIARVVKEAANKDVPVKAFREGEVVGNHGIVFDTEYETLEIRHDAKNRDVFVIGALEAAKFITGKEPGLYSMADVLGLK